MHPQRGNIALLGRTRSYFGRKCKIGGCDCGVSVAPPPPRVHHERLLHWLWFVGAVDVSSFLVFFSLLRRLREREGAEVF